MYITADGSAAQGLYALDRETGEIQWEITGPNIPEPLVRAGDVVLASYTRYESAAFEAADGERQWSTAMYYGDLFGGFSSVTHPLGDVVDTDTFAFDLGCAT